MIERTLALIKPDGVKRSLAGRLISRFEDSGLKIAGMKMRWADKEFATKHYTEDITRRRGEAVRNKLIEYVASGPVIAIVLEGDNAVENVRRITGDTEPKKAAPGTIRGDFAHVTLEFSDVKKRATPNLIHASGNKQEAEYEINLWFNKDELHSYKTVHDYFTLLE